MNNKLMIYLALVITLSTVSQAFVRNVPDNKLSTDGPTTPPVAKVYPASKDQADSVVGDVHAYSAYVSTVRCIDMDPVAGAAFVAYRSSDITGLGKLNYLSTTDDGANYQLSTQVNTATTVRYPAAMADLQNARPWVVYNTAIDADPTKGAYFANRAGGYNTGVWNAEARVDSMGAGLGTPTGMYIGTAYKGTNGVINWLHNYWGTWTPEGAFYYRSTDDGATWSTKVPRSGNLLMYALNGTVDSNNIFGVGNPVIHDSLQGESIGQVALFGSVTGDTLLVASCGKIDSADHVTDRGRIRFWYRLSYDGGLTWTPFTWAPWGGWISNAVGIFRDMGIAIDKDGYPHFVTFILQDTTAGGNYGPNCGLVDYHQTAVGWVSTMIHPIDSLGTNIPRFANFGRDIYGNLLVSYTDNIVDSISNKNIWISKTTNNGASYGKRMVTTDGAGYDYPHLPIHIGGMGSKVPVWYQRGAAGFISWVAYDSIPNGIGMGPVSPGLIYPGNATRINDNTPQFVWHRTAETDTFRVQCSTDAGFAAMVFDTTIRNDTVYNRLTGMADNVYYWRVAAILPNLSDTSDWSPVRTFTVDTLRPRVAYTSPANNATGVPVGSQIKIGFSEKVITGSLGYHCNPDPGGWSAAWNAGQDTVTLTHNSFTALTIYTVTVDSARDMAGNALAAGAVTNPFSFTTVNSLGVGLVAYYPLNGNAGDSSGNGNHGTVNGATPTTDRFGHSSNAYYFNGVSSSIEAAHIVALDFGANSFALSYWVNLGVLKQSFAVGKFYETAGWDQRWNTGFDAAGHAYFHWSNPVVYDNAALTTEPCGTNQWHHLVFIMDRTQGNAKIYVNGTLDTTHASGIGGIFDNTKPLILGYRAEGYNTEYLQGSLDDIRIYNRALTESEILAFYKEGGYLINPVLASPANNAVVNTATPALTWFKVDSATSYRVQVASDSLFASLVQNQLTAAAETTMSLTLADTVYYWRVKAIKSTGTPDSSDWSQTWQFRIDTQAPSCPLSVTANGGNPSIWSNNAAFSINCINPVDVSGIGHYYWKQGSQPTSNYDTTGCFVTKPFNVIATAQGGQQVHVWLVDSAGNTSYLNRDSVKMRYDATAPTGCVASSYVQTIDTAFTVNWNNGSDAGGSGLTGHYQIKYKINTGAWNDLKTDTTGNSIIFTGSHLNRYYFEVAAKDSAGNVETFTSVAECSTLVDTTGMPVPTIISPAVNGKISDNSPQFAWRQHSMTDSFRVICNCRDTLGTIVFNTNINNDTLFNYGGPMADSIYVWRVKAYMPDLSDSSKWSNASQFRVDTQAPVKPTALTADSANPSPWRNNAGYVVNFTNPSDASGIMKYFYKVGSQPASASDTTGNSLTKPFNVTATAQGGQQVHVWLVDSAGNVNFSNRDSVKLRYDIGSPQTNIVSGPSGTTTLDTVKFMFTGIDSAGFTDTLSLQYSCRLDSIAGVWSAYHAFRETSFVYLPDGSHKFEVRSMDLAGNVDPTPAVLNFNAATLLKISNVSPIDTVLPADSAMVTFTKPVNRGQIDASHIVISGASGWSYGANDLYYNGASRTVVIKPDTAFPASDTITVTITGNLSDSLNLTTLDGNNNDIPEGIGVDDRSFTFYTARLGDYDLSGSVNSADLTLFSNAWTNYNRRYELGPYTGTWPQWAPVINASTRLDFEDVMALAASWNNAGKFVLLAAKDGDQGTIYFEAISGDPLKYVARLKPGYNITAMDAILSGADGITIKSIDPGAYWNAEGKPRLFLSKLIDGEHYISAAIWPEAKSGSDELLVLNLIDYGNNEGNLHYKYRTNDIQGNESVVSKIEKIIKPENKPTIYSFGRPYPNPTRSQALIVFGLPKQDRVKLEVFNVLGQRVAVLIDDVKDAGYHTIQWNLRDMQGNRVTNGVYFYKLQTERFSEVRKLVVMR